MCTTHLLLVDDDPHVCDSLSRYFRYNGIETETAGSGEEALSAMQHGAYEALIADLFLPDLNGLAVVREAKTRFPSIAAIVLTGYADVQSAVTALHLGADDYLEKPCEPDKLLQLITKTVEQKGSFRQKELYLEMDERFAEQEKRLEKQFQRLEETTSRLSAILGQIERDKKNNMEGVFSYIKKQLLPLVYKLQQTPLEREQVSLTGELERRLNTILYSLPNKLLTRFSQLTPTEATVVSAIREGFSSKEIAVMHNMSVRTVEVHRENIRKKMGIKNKKINLRNYLLSLEN